MPENIVMLVSRDNYEAKFVFHPEDGKFSAQYAENGEEIYSDSSFAGNRLWINLCDLNEELAQEYWNWYTSIIAGEI